MFSKELERVLKSIVIEVDTVTKETLKEVSKETVKELKATSPKRRITKTNYSNTWRVKDEKDRIVIYNKENYRLTHLLENGHDIIKKGKKVGRAKAHPHIKKAETKAINSFIEKLEEKIRT